MRKLFLSIVLFFSFSFQTYADGSKKLFVYFGGNSSCIRIEPLKQGVYEKRIKPILNNDLNLISVIGCFSGTNIKWIDNISNTNHRSKEIPFSQIKSLAHMADEIVLIGHSWGAWITLKLAEINFHKKVFLVTIDPISFIHCQPLGPWDGCNKFPTDIDQNALFFTKWYNYFQRKSPLHSNRAERATKNVVLSLQHNDIKYNKEIWDLVGEVL